MSASADARIACPGCGALGPDVDGPTHRYIGASPGCWALYGEVLARAYGDVRYASGQAVVDAYAAQHPGTPSPQSIQSVAVHLIRLRLQLERGIDSADAVRAIQQATANKQHFTWLDPPPSPCEDGLRPSGRGRPRHYKRRRPPVQKSHEHLRTKRGQPANAGPPAVPCNLPSRQLRSGGSGSPSGTNWSATPLLQ